MSDDPFVRSVVEALVNAADPSRLRRELEKVLPATVPSPRQSSAKPATESAGSTQLLERIVLADILDDSILGAKPNEAPFPLRLLLSHVGERLDDDEAFTFATGLNFFFRATMDDELKMRVGLQVSALYYRFASRSGLEPQVILQVSPLLASLMSSELSRLRFESIDHHTIFDSTLHERVEGAQSSASAIKPVTFLCRVATSNAVRVRAMVRT